MKAFAFVTLALCLAAVSSVDPGLKLSITPAVINDFTSNFLPQLLTQLGSIKIPNTSLAGFKLSNITIDNLSLSGPDTKVNFYDGRGVFDTQSFALQLHFYLEGKVFGLIPIHFTTGGRSRDSKLTLDVAFGYKDEFVQINLNTLDLTIRNLELDFPKDTLGSIVQAITNLLRGPIQETVSFLVSKVLKGVFQDIINNAFTQIPKVGPIPGTPLGVNFQATQTPVINPTYLLGHINGTFYNIDTGFIIPAVDGPVKTPDFDTTSGKTIQAILSEYTLNTLLDATHKTNKLSINVTNAMIPQEAGLKLTVSWLKQFIPNLNNYFANNTAELILGVKVSKVPVLKVLPGDLGVSVGLALTFYAINDDNSTAHVVSIESNFSIHANATIESWVLKPYIIGGSFAGFNILNSSVGDVDATKFTTGFNVLLMFALPGFNFAKPTFALPDVPGVNLTSLFFSAQPGYLQIQTTPVFTTFNISKLLQRDFTLADYMTPADETEAFIDDYEFLGLN